MSERDSGTNHQPRPIPLLLGIAKGYYEENRTMDSLAKEWGVSRSTVSRSLAEARDRGIVEIRLHDPTHGLRQLSDTLGSLYPVRFRVVPTIVGDSAEQELDRVAAVAAALLGNMVGAGDVIGVAWGTTVRALSTHLPRHPLTDATVVQLNGAGSSTSTGTDYAASILARFGVAFDAAVQSFPVPAFFDDPAARELLWRERSIARILAIQRRMSVMVAGIGSGTASVTSHLYAGDYLEPEDFRELQDERVAGDIATRFFREDGTYEGITLNERSTGPEFSVLAGVRTRLGVVHGRGKVRGLLGALRAGLFTHVVLDETAARALAEASGPGAGGQHRHRGPARPD